MAPVPESPAGEPVPPLAAHLFGDVRILVGGVPVPLRGRRRRLLAAVLALNASRTVPSTRLTAALAPTGPPPSPAAVHVQVHRLRRLLEDAGAGPRSLRTTEGGYRLAVDPGAVDALEFVRLCAAGRQALDAGRPAEAAGLLGRADELGRGDPLGDLLGDATGWPELRPLLDGRAQLDEVRADAELAAGRPAAAVPLLRRLAAEHPEREGVHARLMVALYRAGRQVEALRAYAAHRAWVVGTTGLEPGPDLRRLQAAVLDHDPSLLAGAPAAPHPAVGASPVVDTLERAAEFAARAGGHGQAAECLRLVVALRPDGDERRPYALLRLGQASYDDAGRGAEEARAAAAGLAAAGDEVGTADARLVLARVAWARGDGAAAAAALDAALAVLDRLPRREWPLRLAATAVGLLAVSGQHLAARALADEVLAASPAGPEADGHRGRLLANRGLAALAAGDPGALTDLRAAATLHQRAAGWVPVAMWMTMSDAAAKLGDLPAARDALGEARRGAERQQSSLDLRSVEAELVWFDFWAGNSAAAAAAVRRWLAADDAGDHYLTGSVHCLDARLRLAAGDGPGAERAAARALRAAHAAALLDVALLAPLVAATVRARAGAAGRETARLVSRALDVGAGTFLPPQVGACLPVAVRACGLGAEALAGLAPSPWREAAAAELDAPGSGAGHYRRLGSRPDALACVPPRPAGTSTAARR